MPQQPGPLTLQHTAVLNLQPGNYDLGTYTDTELSQVAGDLAAIDAALVGMEIESGGVSDLITIFDSAGVPTRRPPPQPTSDPAPDFDYVGVLDVVGAAPFDNLDGNMGTMSMGLSDGDVHYGQAAAIAPTECWLNQPAPFDPNADPTVNLNYGDGASVPGPNPPNSLPSPDQVFNQLVTSPLYQFGLLNVTQYGAGQFSVGDQFKITIDGPPYVTLHTRTWFSGTFLGDQPQGQTNEVGHFEAKGTMGPDNVGAWDEEWYGNDVLIQEVAFFVVAANS